MADKQQPSLPPSDPRQSTAPFAGRRDDLDGARPTRAVLVGAAVFGFALVGSGIYLWRRPHPPAEGEGAAALAAPSASAADEAAPAPVAPPQPPSPVTLSDARVTGCHDRGPSTTPPDECDRLPTIEQALGHAIKQAATCVPDAFAGGAIEYVADVSFSRRRVRVSLPRDGRSVRDRKVVHACASAVRDSMQNVPLEAVDHKHARYSIAITATYRGSAPPAGSASGAVPAALTGTLGHGAAAAAGPTGATAATPSPGSVRN
jgi:hypothetical protein